MKIISTIIAAIVLSGCALIPAPFDATLYSNVIVLSSSVDNAVADCGTPGMASQAEMLNYQSKVIVKYTQYTAQDIHPAIVLVDKAIGEMNDVYSKGTPSTTYCKLKLQIIDADLQLILTGLGGKK